MADIGGLLPLIGGAQDMQNSMLNGFNQAITQMAQNRYNYKMWTLQNEYNSPAAQVQRLKDAGLNPALVYGHGNATVPSAQAPRVDLQPVKVENRLPEYISQSQNMQAQKLQMDNLKAQNEVILQEAALKAANLANLTARTARTQFDLGLSQELRNNSLEMANMNLEKLKANTSFTLDENLRKAAQSSAGIAETYTRVAKMRKEMINLGLEGRLKQLDINLKQAGIQPGDPLYARILGQVLGQSGAVDKVIKGLKGYNPSNPFGGFFK